jgi:outer membrane protein assembly factor BamB
MFHHDPQSTGRSKYTGPKMGTIVWKFNVDGPVGSSPAIGQDSTIYFASSYDTTEGGQMPYLYALNRKGILKWKFKLRNSTSFADASQPCSPLVAADGTIYIGSRDQQVYAINPNGTLKWMFMANAEIYPISLTIGIDGTIYFTAADYNLYAINSDGTLKWRSGGEYKFLCSPSAGISFAPDGSIMYLGYLGTTESDTNYGLAAVNLYGQVEWAFQTGLVLGTPVVDNQGNIYFGAGKGIGSVDAGRTGVFSVTSTGELRWKYLAAYMNNYDLTLDYAGNIYFSVMLTGTKIVLISLTNEGNPRWELDLSTIGPPRSSLICDQEGTTYLVAGYASQKLMAVDSKGKVSWQVPFGEVYGNSPALADGRIFLGIWFHNPGKEFYCIQ